MTDSARIWISAAGLAIIVLVVAGCAAAAPAAPSVALKTVAGAGAVPLFESVAPPGHGAIIFEQFTQSTTTGQVANGGPFDPDRLPATFKATFPGGVCTGTLVGPRVLLTAAHCLDTRTAASAHPLTVAGGIKLANENSIHHFHSCELAPAYVAAPVPLSRTPRNAKDWALCELAEAVPEAARETLSMVSMVPVNAADDEVPIMIAGFGCTGLTFTNGLISADSTSSATLTVGENRLAHDRREGWVRAVGRLGSTAAIICPGDSGGAAFVGATLQPGNDVGWRVFAVNSAVGPSDAQAVAWRQKPPHEGAPLTGAELVSYFAPLFDPDFRSFVAIFQARRPDTRQICGVDLPAAGKCRS